MELRGQRGAGEATGHGIVVALTELCWRSGLAPPGTAALCRMRAPTASEHFYERGARRRGLHCSNAASGWGRPQHVAGGAGWQRARSAGGAAGARAHLQPLLAPSLSTTKEQIRRMCWEGAVPLLLEDN